MTSFTRGIKLWSQHALYFSAMVLTVCIPGNILIELIKIYLGDGLSFAMEFRIPMIVDGFISPILAGAILHSTDAFARERRSDTARP